MSQPAHVIVNKTIPLLNAKKTGNGDKEKEKEKTKEKSTKKSLEKKKKKKEGEKRPPPPSVAGWLKKSKRKWKVLSSFHTLIVREDSSQILMVLNWNEMDKLFFPQVTLRGLEGGLPDMWDITPKNTGLKFEKGPGVVGRNLVLLVEDQQYLKPSDLQASIHSNNSRGYNTGFVRAFKPLIVDAKKKQYLIDVTGWLMSFSTYAQKAIRQRRGAFGGGGEQTMLKDIKAFPENFFLLMLCQKRSSNPLKDYSNKTVYFTVAFCRLPDYPMTPRVADRRVGYFTTAITVGGEKLFWTTIKKAVTSWNFAFHQAGYKNDPVKCYSKGDVGFPLDYSAGDARYSAIFMTDPFFSVYGYGPSLTDFRSGEILVGHVLLGFSSFVRGTSAFSLEALQKDFDYPMLEADHPDVVKNLYFTVMHEVGHTLGLRHNFISTEDGKSSVMDYPDDIGHYLNDIGKYDIYAIKYGYTPLTDEKRGTKHQKLNLLANGQDHYEALSPVAQNPLFATDENVFGLDPRVNRWANNVELMGVDKLKFSINRKNQLLKIVESGNVRPEVYSSHIISVIQSCFRSMGVSIRFIGGSFTDRKRLQVNPCSRSMGFRAIKSMVDFMVGPLLRFTAEEQKYMLQARSDYSLDQVDVFRIYQDAVKSGLFLVINQLLRTASIRTMKMTTSSKIPKKSSSSSSSLSLSSSSPSNISAYEALSALCFSPGNTNKCVFSPVSGCGSNSSGRSSNSDSIHQGVALEFQLGADRLSHHLVHAAACMALISDIKRIADAILDMPGLSKMARTHWSRIADASEKEEEEPNNHTGDHHHHLQSSHHQHINQQQQHPKCFPHRRKDDQDIKESTTTTAGWLSGGGCWHCAMYKSGMNSHQGRSAGYDDEDRAKPEIRNLTTRSML
eukprot:jgi/Bigna1/90695/estExt_fgenesh1_pg.C_760107